MPRKKAKNTELDFYNWPNKISQVIRKLGGFEWLAYSMFLHVFRREFVMEKIWLDNIPKWHFAFSISDWK